jgi:hypothetical protein
MSKFNYVSPCKDVQYFISKTKLDNYEVTIDECIFFVKVQSIVIKDVLYLLDELGIL